MAANYEWFSLTFRNTKTGTQRDVRFLINENPLAQKWASLLKDILKSKNHLEKNYLLHGWIPGPKSLDYLCSGLNGHIEVINHFFADRPQGLHYHIPLHFDPHTVDQHILNLIHHDFELLIGQVWDVAKYFKVAPPEVQYSIRQLNNLCHEIEAQLSSQAHLKDGRCSAAIITSIFPRKRLNLNLEEKKTISAVFQFW